MTSKLLVPEHLQKKPRAFEMVQYISDFLEGSFDDWPAQIQDEVMNALNRCAKKHRVALQLVGARCDIDYGAAMDHSEDRVFIHMLAVEMLGVAYSESEVEKYETGRPG